MSQNMSSLMVTPNCLCFCSSKWVLLHFNKVRGVISTWPVLILKDQINGCPLGTGNVWLFLLKKPEEFHLLADGTNKKNQSGQLSEIGRLLVMADMLKNKAGGTLTVKNGHFEVKVSDWATIGSVLVRK
jgi:hypothetical protein